MPNAIAVNSHKFVFQRHDHLIAASITLTTAASEELSIDAPRFVTLRANYVKTAALRYPRTQADVGSPPGHIGRHRDLPWLSGLGNDCGFFTVLARIKHPMGNPRSRQQPAQVL